MIEGEALTESDLASNPGVDASWNDSRFAPVEWAEESCRIVNRAGFYPEHKVDRAYTAAWVPIVREQLGKAGQRLAAMLNEWFGKN